jgi:hypothetical protein
MSAQPVAQTLNICGPCDPPKANYCFLKATGAAGAGAFVMLTVIGAIKWIQARYAKAAAASASAQPASSPVLPPRAQAAGPPRHRREREGRRRETGPPPPYFVPEGVVPEAVTSCAVM